MSDTHCNPKDWPAGLQPQPSEPTCPNCEKEKEKRRKNQERLEQWVDRCAELARKHARRGCVIEKMCEYEEEYQTKLEDYIRKDHAQRAKIEDLLEEVGKLKENIEDLKYVYKKLSEKPL
jgi:archaellum component FlaC